MASGKTLELIAVSDQMLWARMARVQDWSQKKRDRSLNGKARIRARKAARRVKLAIEAVPFEDVHRG